MPNLPQELIYDILSVSPVKSLLRFRCVSNSFYDIISSKSFINYHIRTCSEKRIHRKLIHNYDYLSKIRALDINDGSEEEFRLDFDMPRISQWNAAYCNGLLLISTAKGLDESLKYYKFSIWNPSTRQHKELRGFPVNFVNNNNPIKVSFGYDATADDFKVVIIITNKKLTFEVWILGLRSGCWRRIQDVNPDHFGLGFHNENNFVHNCFVDGSMHFLRRNNKYIKYECTSSHSILALDIAKETLSTVPLPRFGHPLLLQDFEGCLCVGLWTEQNFGLYVRKRDGVEFSWTKLFSFATQQISELGFIRILGYSKDERDKILLTSFTNIMYSYDLKERSLQEIEMKNTGRWTSILCVESLVSVCSSI